MNQLVRQLFDELVALTVSERESVLAERRLPPEIRAEVESLLNFDSTGNREFTECVSHAAAAILRFDSASPLPNCGPYRLIRPLGSGGMGAVYLAERRDGEVQQEVAVKLLRAGGNRPGWRTRFLKERQFLATLNHPSIVHLIDAGHTDEGLPYLVMEYIEGIPIDVYVEKLELREQLKLFLRVCESVSHAHRHLIIHRDLKPSNILVDASGQPKLLDFGIAKLLDETGEPTQTIERFLTPGYASPEQLRGAIQTTATDVYSLGAVLYKLLTGRSPHETGVPGAADVDVIAGKREIPSPTRLNPALPMDIEYILRKALRTEPEERYISVDAFVDDIRALLDWRPVQAHSCDIWYRARRFVRRLWAPITAAAFVTASLLMGLYVVNRERAIAQQRFLDVRQLANRLFDIDYQARQLPGNSKTRQLIVDTSLEYLRSLTTDVQGDVPLALELGNAYLRVARIQGVPISANLGQVEQAEQNLRIAQGFIAPVLASQPGNREALLRSAQIAHDRMILAGLKGQQPQEMDFAEASADHLEKLLATGTLDRPEAEAVTLTCTNIARRFMHVSVQSDEGMRLLNRAIEIGRSFNWQGDIGIAHQVEAEVHRQKGELEEALRVIQESVKLLEPPPGNRDQGRALNLVSALILQGDILGEEEGLNLGRSEEAAMVLGRAFRIADEVVHEDPNDLNSRDRAAGAAIRLAGALRRSDPGQSLAIYNHALGHLAEVKNNPKFRRTEARTLAQSTYPLRTLGRSGEARRRLDEAFSRLHELELYPVSPIEPGSEAEDVLRAAADADVASGDLSRAIEKYRKLLDVVFRASPRPESSLEDAAELSNLFRSAATLYRRAKQPDLATNLESRRVDLWRQWESKLPHNAFVHRELEAANLR